MGGGRSFLTLCPHEKMNSFRPNAALKFTYVVAARSVRDSSPNMISSIRDCFPNKKLKF